MNHFDRSSEQIQADIQRTRGDLDRTLTLLERRLEPRRIMDQGVSYLRDNGAREYISNLGQAAKEQPLPLALVGVGLAWMMMINGRATDRRALGNTLGSAATDAGSRAGEDVDGLGSRVSELGSKVSGAASQVASQTRNAAQRTSQSLSDAADAARGSAAQVSEATRQGAQKLRSGYDHLVNEQPLALGAIGLAIGAVLAAVAPRTRQEDAWMGSSSDELLDEAKRAGKEKLEEVRRPVSEAAERVANAVGPSDSNGRSAESARQLRDRDAQQGPDGTQPPEQGSGTAHDPRGATTPPDLANVGTAAKLPI